MGNTVYKTCADCGKRFRIDNPRSRHRKYCRACVERRAVANQKTQKQRVKDARHSIENRTQVCAQCGTEFLRPAGRAGAARKRCDACRATPVSRRTLPESRPCEGCGELLHLKPYDGNLRFCQTCRVERMRTQDRELKSAKRTKTPRILTCQRCGIDFEKGPLGRDPRACPECRKADYESRRPPRKTTSEDRYRWRLARQYAMTVEQRETMADRQGHACALCGVPESANRKLHIDHDHSCCPAPGTSCGKCIRGLICYSCNNALGLINDDLEILRRMVSYIRDGGVPRSPNRSRRK